MSNNPNKNIDLISLFAGSSRVAKSTPDVTVLFCPWTHRISLCSKCNKKNSYCPTVYLPTYPLLNDLTVYIYTHPCSCTYLANYSNTNAKKRPKPSFQNTLLVFGIFPVFYRMFNLLPSIFYIHRCLSARFLTLAGVMGCFSK